MDENNPQAIPSIKSQEYTIKGIPSPTKSQSVREQSIQRQQSPTRNPSLKQEPLQPSLSPKKYFSKELSMQRPTSPTQDPSDKNSIQKLPRAPSIAMNSNGAVQIPIKSPNTEPEIIEATVSATVASLEPKSKNLSDHINELTETVNKLSRDISNPLTPVPDSNINKIANMSKVLTDEASALRKSIRCLSEDIVKTKQLFGCNQPKEDVNFPHHLFLIEIIINKIHMKCDCFDMDFKNLVITAAFLGKQPIALYDSSYGKLYNLTKINMGKSILFAMTYDKICSINEFEVLIELTKQPPCTTCIQRIGETRMDYTNEFIKLREELCQKWMSEQPNDNISCTTSTPLSKNMYYVTCGDLNHQDSIGVIEVSFRMSFLGKEVTTTFSGPTHSECTSGFAKGDRGMTIYSCQNVEMDDQGKVLLDEEVFNKKSPPCRSLPASENISIPSPMRHYQPNHYDNRYDDDIPKYDEILTKMNANELKIKVPKTTMIERSGKYDRIQELCTCESTPYNTGEQLQLELPPDVCGPDNTHRTHTSKLQYTYRGCDKTCESKNRKIISVTPTNCPAPVTMEKVLHPLKDVFVLKIGKKLETKDKKTELEIELTTPKLPEKSKQSNLSQQCSSDNLKLKEKSSKTSKTSKSGKKKKKKKYKKGGKEKKPIQKPGVKGKKK